MPNQVMDPQSVAELRGNLLAWYSAKRRDLPWRRTPWQSDPYAIWVSEMMLQQTRVAAVVERFQAFLVRFPTIDALATAPEQDVLALWSGLGYYRRARMMHKTAQMAGAREPAGLPATAAELRTLPGIGAYTAAAIASIAHGEPVPVVDGNVERVLCRLNGIGATGGGTGLRRKIEHLAAQLLDSRRAGDFNQAMMELGATVCLPRNPRCAECPLESRCLTRGEHKTRPRPPMQSREIAQALAVRVSRNRGSGQSREVLLEQRPASLTVMPSLWELPALRSAEMPEGDLRMTVSHSIMQVNYTVRIRAVSESDADAITAPAGKREWVPLDKAGQMPLTGLARKVLSLAHLLPAPRLASPAPPMKSKVVEKGRQ
ncbi:MAG: A/G-specific adenine glycosylase [Terracidiphilus sp.]